MKKNIFYLLLFPILFFSCKKNDSDLLIFDQQAVKEDSVIRVYLKDNKISANKTANGAYYYFIKEGKGNLVSIGDSLNVQYTGNVLYSKVFDSSYFRDKAYPVRIGVTSVIAGWTEALQLMREGSRAVFIMPSRLGYGTSGSRSGNVQIIPPNAILQFDLEITYLKRQ
ncbi:MAG: hypothetical protein EAZ97_10885 [Bacteroidetes bacterium]|nr:MAG: hypothetical protein EAZ97_10885 [Bacteroidota bacterium]